MRGTIKSKEDVERLFQTGRRSSSSLMTILMRETDTGTEGRCAFIAGKKLGCAPVRNRCKRVMREAARALGAPWKGYEVIFIARKKIACERHDRVLSQMGRCLSKLEVS